MTDDDELLERARNRIGSVLRGKYRLDDVLGVGSTSVVYAATHLRHANRVAVKVLHPELTLNSALRERFLREGYAANSVGHPGTVHVHDDDTADDGTVFLVLELLEGETLEARWERLGYRIPVRDVVLCIHRLLDVLKAAHAKGIIHRDIKPENLFLTHDGGLKVLDFGVARLIEGSVKRTRSGGVLGTPVFMPPEQVLGKTREIDARSDLWSAGATAFTLLSGHYVHEGETPEEVMVFAGSRRARSLASVAPGVPPLLVQVFDRALRFDKSERWRDASAMQQALASAYEKEFGLGISGHPSEEEDGPDAKTTVQIDETTTIMPEREHEGSPPSSDRSSETATIALSDSIRPLSQQHSLIDTVTATTTDDIPTLAQHATRKRVRPNITLLVAAAVLGASLGSVLALLAVKRSTAAMAAPVPSESPAPSSIAQAPPAFEPSPTPISADTQDPEPPTVAVESLPTTPPQPTAVPKPQPTLTAPTSLPVPPPVSSVGNLAKDFRVPQVAAPAQKASQCTPPFDIDPKTGEKKWRLECL